jgi:hypothetical protein
MAVCLVLVHRRRSSVDMVTVILVGGSGNPTLISGRRRDFSLLNTAQNGNGARETSYSTCTGGLFLRV